MQNKNIPFIQVLRGVAASLVVFHHFALGLHKYGVPTLLWQFRIGQLGACGVDIFFVISGFIMAHTTRMKTGPKDAIEFLRRRADRIYPLYWLCTTAFVIFYCIFKGHPSAKEVLFSYALIPYFNGTTFQPLLGQGWTLSFELFFYLVFAIAITLKLRHSRLFFVIGSFSLFALAALLLPVCGIRHLLTDSILIEFIFGILCAELFPYLKEKMAPVLIIAGAICLSASVFIEHTEATRFIFWGIPSFAIVLGCAVLKKSAPRFLVYLGNASYSIYLMHSFFSIGFDIISSRIAWVHRIPGDLTVLFLGSITIVCTAATYPLIESKIHFPRA